MSPVRLKFSMKSRNLCNGGGRKAVPFPEGDVPLTGSGILHKREDLIEFSSRAGLHRPVPRHAMMIAKTGKKEQIPGRDGCRNGGYHGK